MVFDEHNHSAFYFLLYSNCKMVRGASQSTICDLFRNRYYLIPDVMYTILSEFKNDKIGDILTKYESEKEGIIKFLDFFIENDWGFITDTPENFPDMSDEWDAPTIITNAVIDYNETSTYDILEVLEQLADMGCEAVQMRFFSLRDKQLIIELYEKIEGFFHYTELITKYDEYIVEYIHNNCMTKSSFQKAYYFGAPLNSSNTIITDNCMYLEEIFLTKHIVDSDCCGVVSMKYFAPTIDMFMESLNHNSCLNRKIGVDIHGNIKNCPSSKKSYGHVSNTLLKDTVNNDFKELWSLNKNQIDTCKICEYRMICTDCRVFIEDPQNIRSKPAKCNYDPITTVWK